MPQGGSLMGHTVSSGRSNSADEAGNVIGGLDDIA
jgi:hypothetical protein